MHTGSINMDWAMPIFTKISSKSPSSPADRPFEVENGT